MSSFSDFFQHPHEHGGSIFDYVAKLPEPEVIKFDERDYQLNMLDMLAGGVVATAVEPKMPDFSEFLGPLWTPPKQPTPSVYDAYAVDFDALSFKVHNSWLLTGNAYAMMPVSFVSFAWDYDLDEMPFPAHIVEARAPWVQ